MVHVSRQDAQDADEHAFTTRSQQGERGEVRC